MVTKAEYDKLLDDRPRKFGPGEVGFQVRSDDAHVCCGCIHWFANAARGAAVCEILRLPGEQDIPPQARCRFWTPDGEWYPLLDDNA